MLPKCELVLEVIVKKGLSEIKKEVETGPQPKY